MDTNSIPDGKPSKPLAKSIVSSMANEVSSENLPTPSSTVAAMITKPSMIATTSASIIADSTTKQSSPPPQSHEITTPLVRFASSLSSSDHEDEPDDITISNVDKLRDELFHIKNKLEDALRMQSLSSLVKNKHEGSVDVDFVRTKPSMWGRIRCKATNVKTILHNFHADFPEGCVTALMGPSGAGKTTLLDFLTGMLGDGVHACGKVALPDDDAYVPQDDRLHGFYTCQMYMEHYARLTGMSPLFDCCSSKKNVDDQVSVRMRGEDEEDGEVATTTQEDDVNKLIADIISEVGLTNQKHTVVGGMFKRGLSGGQKRRLSVALEALSSPLNLFLDEPTSGLDSESALALMQYLKGYARGKDPLTGRRRRVIVTIHQPSSHIWELIDNVVLLAEGRLMYQGPRQTMNDFFESYGHPVPRHYNPADHFIEVLFKIPDVDADGLSEMHGDPNAHEMWSKCFRQWRKEEIETSVTHQSQPNWAKRKTYVVRSDPVDRKRDKVKRAAKKSTRSAIELTRRSFVDLLRNPIALGLRLAIYGGMSLTIGILFFDLESKDNIHAILLSRSALLYFIIAFCSSMSVAVIPFAIVDRGIVEKEVRNHVYHPAFYHASQSLASVPVCLVLALVVSIIVLGMTGLGRAGIQTNVHFGVILFFTFLCADATSMFVAHISPEMISAICISSGIFGVFTMFMGFMVTPENIPVWLRWLYYVPFMTYSFRSLMYIEYSELNVNASDLVQANPLKGSSFGSDQENITNVVEDSISGMRHLKGDYFGLDQVNITNAFSQPIEVGDSTLKDPSLEDVIFSEAPSFNGTLILDSFEMGNVNVSHDLIVLVFWGIIMHALSITYLCWKKHKGRRHFVYSD